MPLTTTKPMVNANLYILQCWVFIEDKSIEIGARLEAFPHGHNGQEKRLILLHFNSCTSATKLIVSIWIK